MDNTIGAKVMSSFCGVSVVTPNDSHYSVGHCISSSPTIQSGPGPGITRSYIYYRLSQSWSQMFFGGVKSSGLQYYEPEVMEGRRVVKPPKPVFDEGAKRWKNALWPVHWPWLKNFERIEFENKKVPVWVKFLGIPLELMTSNGLSYVASGIGVPLYLEKAVENIMSDNSARICVEMEEQGEKPGNIDVIVDDGSLVKVKVEFPLAKTQQQMKKAVQKWVKKDEVNKEIPMELKDPRNVREVNGSPKEIVKSPVASIAYKSRLVKLPKVLSLCVI
ncbi:hypothetical protein CRG98_000914 [Punica granatum]|uniref:Uncharacterized protein n=1 Tax=Punica granatum TaxID=22663 RepID=A0A2I0LDD7_PUNGR|nr:hypothetical protein CRG98_000914 [Punica granatum]